MRDPSATNPADSPAPCPTGTNLPVMWLVLGMTLLVAFALFRGSAPTPDGAMTGRKGPAPAPSMVERDAPIHRALDKVVDVRFTNTPLEEAIDDLVRQMEIPLWIDTQTLTDEGVNMKQPITLHAGGISGRAALNLLLMQCELAWVVENEVLKITSFAKAGEALETRVYDVTDLVVVRDAKENGRFSLTALMNVLTSVARDSWQDMSGPGSVIALPAGNLQALAVLQTQDVHEKVARLLADLRQARRKSNEKATRPVLVSSDQSPGALREAAIRRALDDVVVIEGDGRSIHDVVTDIAGQINAPLYFDRRTLTDEGVDLNAPVTFRHSGLSARAALKLILEPVMLAWVVRNEVLFITTLARASDFLETHVYDVADIVPKYRASGGGPVRHDFTSLMNAISSTVQPNSDWVNGPGVINPYREGGILAIVIPQSQAVHEEVAEFLEDLRKLCAERAARFPNEPLPEPKNRFPVQRALSPSDLANPGREALVRGCNQFALELYARLARDTRGNLLFSPFYVSAATAAAYAGARGNTQAEINRTMYYVLRQEDVPAAFRTLRNSSVLWGWDARVSLSNQLWGQKGIEIVGPFRETLRNSYQVEVATVDFSDPAEAAQLINDWTVAKTNGSILRLASPGDFADETRLVLTSVAQFIGTWTNPFDRKSTTLAKFGVGDAATDVALMHLAADRCRYAVVDGVEVLEKGYGNGDVSMVVLLPPNGPTGLADLDGVLTESNVAKWLSAQDSPVADVYLPRFRLESAFNLRRELDGLGMHSTFDPSAADFSGISASQKLALAAVIHKAAVVVDEQGHILGPTPPAEPPKINRPQVAPPVFRADRPFLFLIRDNRTGVIVFMGRVVRPESAPAG
jgi:serine protease inhibitor